MQINTTGRHLDSDPVVSDLIGFLRSNEVELELSDAQIYYDFPIFKELDGGIVISKVLLVSPRYGVVIIETSDVTSTRNLIKELPQIENHIDRVLRKKNGGPQTIYNVGSNAT
jgi:hypothetical protein